MDDCIKGEEGGRGDDARWCRTFFFLLIWVAMADGEEEALAAAAASGAREARLLHRRGMAALEEAAKGRGGSYRWCAEIGFAIRCGGLQSMGRAVISCSWL
jgi:hypothetical protein